MGLAGGDVTAMPALPSKWLSVSSTSPYPVLIYA